MKNELKLYIMDLQYYGMLIVTATSESEARKKMKKYEHYLETKDIKEFEINSNLEYITYLDS